MDAEGQDQNDDLKDDKDNFLIHTGPSLLKFA